jgi:hypothetical protein
MDSLSHGHIDPTSTSPMIEESRQGAGLGVGRSRSLADCTLKSDESAGSLQENCNFTIDSLSNNFKQPQLPMCSDSGLKLTRSTSLTSMMPGKFIVNNQHTIKTI